MNYPGCLNKKKSKQISYSNRGMSLEYDINESNNYYLVSDIAVIHKKPTPITIVDVDYPSRSQAVITKAYFKVASTTDYNGIYKGKYIDFEAKETRNKTGFPLINIHEHQINHLMLIEKHGGISFIIVRFTALNETYLLPSKKMKQFLDNNNKTSIPIEYFKKNGYLIKDKFNPRVDYLAIIDSIYLKGEVYENDK